VRPQLDDRAHALALRSPPLVEGARRALYEALAWLPDEPLATRL
jgi:hypothetical protein